MSLKTLTWAIYKNEDDQLVVNYIHRGSIDILNEHYRDLDKVKELFSHGNLAKLAPKINPDPETPHEFQNWDPDVCIFFHRDYGDPKDLCELEYFESEKDFLDSEKIGNTIYFFDGNEWTEISMSDAIKRGKI